MDGGVEVTERLIKIDEVFDACREGRVSVGNDIDVRGVRSGDGGGGVTDKRNPLRR